MIKNKVNKKVSNFLTKEFNKKLYDISVFDNGNGSYELFNRYLINKDPLGYRVSIKYQSDDKLFSSLKIAVTWCIFEKRNNVVKFMRVEYLDTMINGAEMAINNHRRLVKSSKDINTKLVYIAKLSEEKAKHKAMTSELAKFVVESKYWQNRTFDNT